MARRTSLIFNWHFRFLIVGILLFPFITLAAEAGTNTFKTLVFKVVDIINLLIPIVVALGVIYLLWGLASYLMAGGGIDVKKAREKMIYGVLGLLVMLSLWGFVSLLSNVLLSPPEVESDQTSRLPENV